MPNLSLPALGVKRAPHRSQLNSTIADSDFKSIRPSIIDRDSNTCQFCSFYSNKFQEVHHLNDNHFDNTRKNLVTACCLCHACFHIGFNSLNSNSKIIYLPELTQVELNALSRSLWILDKAETNPYARQSISVETQLNTRAIQAASAIGSSNPKDLGGLLSTLTNDEYKNRASFLKDFRLLHDSKLFSRQIEHWSLEASKSLPVSDWNSFHQAFD